MSAEWTVPCVSRVMRLSRQRRHRVLRERRNDATDSARIPAYHSLLITHHSSVRHLVVIQPNVMADLVDDGILHLLVHFVRSPAESENGPAVDRDTSR